MTQTKPKQKILVVDDDDSYREIIAETLESSGYDIIQADNGFDGLSAAKLHRPDLILCDVNMPKMDGIAFLNSLREVSDLSGIPFIFLTGNSDPEDMRKGMRLGADDYLTKPFSIEDLVNAVEARLQKKDKIEKYYESQYDDIKSNIVSSLPHEFRTPLNSILGFSQILKEENSFRLEDVKEIAGMIYKSGERLHRLLENMVLYGQLQLWSHDQEKIKGMRNESSSTLEIIQISASQLMEKHGRQEAVQCSDKNSFVQISNIYLAKILEEIVENALKFSQAGDTVQIVENDNGKEIHIVVQDNGRGMTEEQIKKISGFQQFERNYFEQQGAGLGLVIAKMLIEMHGGSLSIESQLKKGTTVTVGLPKIQK